MNQKQLVKKIEDIEERLEAIESDVEILIKIRNETKE